MAPNTRVFNGSLAVGGQKCQWRSTGKWAMGPREVMHRGAHMGGGHPRWEMEWVGGIGVMAQGQEMGGGCANRIWGQWQPWVGGGTKIGMCVCKKSKNVDKI